MLVRLRERMASEELPSLRDIERLTKLERQLEAAEMVKDAKRLTREE
jgi:hypothetical protein